MDYEKRVNFRGDRAKALEVARGVFVQEGFAITMQGPHAFDAAGPGLLSTRQNPLLAVSRATVTAGEAHLSIAASLGGARRLVKLLAAFLVVLAAALAGLFALLMPQTLPWILLVTAAPFAPWVVLLPALGHFVRLRARRALDVLMGNMAAIAAAS